MAYFDSPKNKALWEKELAGLRKMKEERRAGDNHSKVSSDEAISTDKNSVREGSKVSSVYREKTSYKQLLLEEAASVRSRRKLETSKAATKQRDYELDVEASF